MFSNSKFQWKVSTIIILNIFRCFWLLSHSNGFRTPTLFEWFFISILNSTKLMVWMALYCIKVVSKTRKIKKILLSTFGFLLFLFSKFVLKTQRQMFYKYFSENFLVLNRKLFQKLPTIQGCRYPIPFWVLSPLSVLCFSHFL